MAKEVVSEKKQEKQSKKVLDPGQKLKVVDYSEATDKTTTVRGIHAGKVAKYGSAS